MSKKDRKPEFKNILKVLRREAPDRPTLFEFFLNFPLYEKLAGARFPADPRAKDINPIVVKAFEAAGYDYATVLGSDFKFNTYPKQRLSTQSQNENAPVPDREAFDAYDWPDHADFDYGILDDIVVPDGMKLMLYGPGGVLENAVELAGYENLCMQIYEDPQFVHDLFEKVGADLLSYYRISLSQKGKEKIGIIMSNDDWGFKTQTLLSPKHLREFVFPWHKKIVELGHDAGLPVVLHSCGCFEDIMDDTIDDMKYDGKHSYQDNIQSVEDAYREWGGRIAILGGIDLDFVCRKTPDEIRARSLAMLELGRKGYALGTGNSVPEYVPDANYFAMTSAALEG